MRSLPLLVVCLIVVGSGVIHGLIIDRWGSSGDLGRAVASLQQIPNEFGDWKSQEPTTSAREPISARELEVGEIDGYLARIYTNPANGSTVNLMIVCGRPGPISVHTPDICFKGAGFEIVKQYQRHQIASTQDNSETAEAFFADFTKPVNAAEQNLRVFWMWSDGRQFFAPDNPRIAFADKDFLYKIYLTRAIERVGDPPETDQCVSFFKLAMPILQRSLFSEQKPKI